MDEYIIISPKHMLDSIVVFWKDNFNGYTSDLNQAGRYTLEEIRDAKYDFPIYKSNVIYTYDIDNFIIEEAQVSEILYNCWKFK